MVENRAQISAEDAEALRKAGFDHSALAGDFAHAALNLFINYVNVTLDVPVDYPAALPAGVSRCIWERLQ
ncbi:MAG TPA: hypothetical protein VFI93_11760 [Rhizomicrobium sp.]|nr:hypothetical protein [Rhizomicrobium sp.]